MLRKGALLLVLGVLFCLPVQAQDLTLETVLDRHFDALGGLEQIQGIQTMEGTGRMTVGPGMEAAFIRYAKRPNKVRLEIEIQGMTGIQAFDGETAWMFMPFMGQTSPEIMPDDMAAAMLQEADMDGPLVDYQTKGNQVELLGMEGSVYKLQVTLGNGDVQYYHINADTFLLDKVTGSMTMQGMDLEFETAFSDFRDVNGLIIPHHIDMTGMQGPGSEGVVIIDSLQINSEIDDSIFVMQ
jgi:outer membrane lipoprotein-sorting protein